MKRFLINLITILISVTTFAQIDWRLQPMRMTAKQNNTTIWLICHVDNDKQIVVHYDIYNAQGESLCRYVLTTPNEDNGGNTERKGYLVGEENPGNGIALWLTLESGTHLQSLNKGDYVIVYGDNPNGIGSGTFTTERHLTHNIMSGTVDIAGNVMSLLVGDDPLKLDTAVTIPRAVCFARLFNQNSGETSDEIVTGLHSGPIHVNDFYLPATNLTHACYDRMFNSCNTLLDIPRLPATEIPDFAYLQMFGGCYKIKEIPEFAAMHMGEMACRHTFWKCYKLETAYLPAEELSRGCYGGMFRECTGMKKIKVQFTDWQGGSHTANWVEGVPSTCIFDHPYQLEGSEDDVNHVYRMRTTSTVEVTEDDTITEERAWIYKNRHIEVGSGKTLTMGMKEIGVGEIATIRDAHVVVPEGTSVNAKSLMFMSDQGITGDVQADGAIHSIDPEQQLPCTLNYAFRDTLWHTIFFPAACTTMNTDEVVGFQMQTLNAKDNTWSDYAGMPKGQTGYRIRAKGGVASFDFTTNLDKGEKKTSVAMKYAAGGDPSSANWNVIGNPYMRAYGNTISQRYAYLPSDDFQSFTVYHTDELTLQPFAAYLTQAAAASPIEFGLSPVERDIELEADILLSDGLHTTRTGVLFDSRFSNDYEFNADLALLAGAKDSLQIYSLPNSNQPLAFAAVDGTELDEAEVTLPLGFKAANINSSLTFSLSERISPKFTHIWLDDKDKKTSVDLLSEDYTATADELASNTRFALRFTTKEDKTGLEDIDLTNADNDSSKIFVDGKIYILRNGTLYTLQGQIVR